MPQAASSGLASCRTPSYPPPHLTASMCDTRPHLAKHVLHGHLDVLHDHISRTCGGAIEHMQVPRVSRVSIQEQARACVDVPTGSERVRTSDTDARMRVSMLRGSAPLPVARLDELGRQTLRPFHLREGRGQRRTGVGRQATQPPSHTPGEHTTASAPH